MLTVLTSALASLPAPVSSQGLSCGVTITANTTLTSDIGPCSGGQYGVALGANGITLNCAGHVISSLGGAVAVGISLDGTSNDTVENCNVTGFAYGVHLLNSTNSYLLGNTANNDIYYGLLLEDSSNNTISGNTANNATVYGFLLDGSSNNTLVRNTANDEFYDCGFDLSESNFNLLTNNTANDNSFSGYQIISSSNNTLHGNTADGNVEAGFAIVQESYGVSAHNTLTGNTAADNNVSGFQLSVSNPQVSHRIISRNTFAGNTAYNNTIGFSFLHSSNNTLAGNAATDNGDGIFTIDSNDTFARNTIEDNGNGVVLIDSDDTLTGNIVTGNTVPNLIITGTTNFPPNAVVTSRKYGSNQPAGTGPVSLDSPIFYDVQVSHIPGGVANLCLANVTSRTSVLQFWNGTDWVSAANQTISGATPTLAVCGSIPVSELSGTPIVTGTPIASSVFLDPSSGAVGTTVTMTGAGLSASQVVTATFGATPVTLSGTCKTFPTGTLGGCTFTVPPSSALGPYTVAVRDGTHGLSATFTVTLVGVTCSRSTVLVGTPTICEATVHESGKTVPAGTVTWSSSSSGAFSTSASCRLSHTKHATFSTCVVRFTPTSADSSVLVTASYGSYAAAGTGGYDLSVTMKASKTTASCSPTSVPALSSKTVTCNAKVTGYLPTGTVSWSQSGAGSVSFVAASCTLSKVSLSASSCSVTLAGAMPGKVLVNATYAGDPNNLPGSATHKLSIGKALPTVSIPCPSTALSVGTPVSCTATVTGYSPTGTVTWGRGSGAGRVTFSTRTCTLSGGSCQVTITATKSGPIQIVASYSGDSNNQRSLGRLQLTAS